MVRKILGLFFVLITFSRVGIAADISWSSPPTTISSTGVDSSDARVVIDATGNATAVWNEGGLIRYSIAPVNMSFGSAGTIPSSGTGNSSPRARIDGSGNVIVIWLDSTNTVQNATLSSGSWSSILPVSASSASTPSLAVDATGNAVAVWVRGGFIETSTKPAGGSWNSTTMLTTTNVSNHPDVAIGSGGTVCAAWHTVVSGQDQILANTKSIAGSWGTTQTVIANSFSHDFPKVAVDANGNVAVVWYRYTLVGGSYTNLYVLYAGVPAGSSVWSVPIATSATPGQGNPANLRANFGFDANGNAITVYSISYNGGTFNVESVVKQNGAAVTQPDQFVVSNNFAFYPDLDVHNSLGSALAVFMFYDGMNVLIQSAESYIAQAPQNINLWSAPINLSNNVNNSFPRCAHSVTGGTLNAAAVWIYNDGMNNLVHAVTGSRAIVLPPGSVTVSQNSVNYGGFTDYYNTVSWGASSDPNLSQYVLFRNGVFVAVLDSTVTSYIDHNQVNGGPVTYGVAATDTMNNQSVIITDSYP